MSDPYLTLGGPAGSELRERGSTFLARAAPASTENEARAVLAGEQGAHRDATHHCSAWRLHGGVWRANDAGEPSGSAGAPILAAIDGAGLEDCVVVVTRYYGGTRLGVGGLVRAYGEAAAAALARAPRRRAVPALRLRVSYPYEHTAAVMRLVERFGAHAVEHGYEAGGAAGRVELVLPAAEADAFGPALREQTAGALEPERLGGVVLYLPAERPEHGA